MPRHRFTDTRERIEKAAIRLFVEKGVAETTVRDIARAVEISEGALYRHFVSKEDLVWDVFERNYVAFASRLDALAQAETSAHAKLAAMIRGFCHAHDEDPALFRFLLFVQHGQLSRLAPGTPTPVDSMRAVLERGIVSKETVEIKRRGEIDGVEQLTRYLELMNRDPLLAPVRGVFAAQQIRPQARTLAEDRGIRCVVVDYDALRGAESDDLRLF